MRESGKEPEIGPNWMITFSDLCTLLLTFFVLILSMSSLNKMAFRASFRNFDRSAQMPMPGEHQQAPNQRDLAIQEMSKNLDGLFDVNLKEVDQANEKDALDPDLTLVDSWEKTIWIRKPHGSDSFSFILGEKLLFDSGSAELHPSAQLVLEIIGNFLRESVYKAYIDGHTDNDPLGSERFTDNDELSIARARAVLDFFLLRCNAAPERLAYGGYGSSHPLTENKTREGKAMNRRVEIIFDRAT